MLHTPFRGVYKGVVILFSVYYLRALETEKGMKIHIYFFMKEGSITTEYTVKRLRKL
jgi:hypothetical protein